MRRLIEKENSKRVRYYIVEDEKGWILIHTENKAVALRILKNGL